MSFLRRLARHQIGALAATGVDFTTMIALVEWVHLSAVAATAIGAACGAITNFSLGRTWIFRGAEGRLHGQAARYLVVSAGSLVLNSGGEYLVNGLLGVPYLPARVLVAALVSLLWNFPLHRFFVFPTAEVHR